MTTRTDVTSVIVHSKTPLHRRVQASVLWELCFMRSHILSSNAKCCHSARFNCSPFNRRSVRPAVAQSFSHHLNRHKDHVPALGGRVRFQCSHHTRFCLLVHTRFCQGPQLQCDAQTTPLSRGVCTSAPQRQRTQTTGCEQNKNTVKWDINGRCTHIFLGV